MFVVAPAARVQNPDDSSKFGPQWSVVYENEVTGGYDTPVAKRPSREAAQGIADDLNAVLTAD